MYTVIKKTDADFDKVTRECLRSDIYARCGERKCRRKKKRKKSQNHIKNQGQSDPGQEKSMCKSSEV